MNLKYQLTSKSSRPRKPVECKVDRIEVEGITIRPKRNRDREFVIEIPDDRKAVITDNGLVLIPLKS